MKIGSAVHNKRAVQTMRTMIQFLAGSPTIPTPALHRFVGEPCPLAASLCPGAKSFDVVTRCFWSSRDVWMVADYVRPNVNWRTPTEVRSGVFTPVNVNVNLA